MEKQKFPTSWDGERVRWVIDHYENQTEEEAVAEDEAAWDAENVTHVGGADRTDPRCS